MKTLHSIAVAALLVMGLAPFARANDADESPEAQLRALRAKVEAQNAELERGDATLRALRDRAATTPGSVEEAIDAYLDSRQIDTTLSGSVSSRILFADDDRDYEFSAGGLVTAKARFFEPDSTGRNGFHVADARLDFAGTVSGKWNFAIQADVRREDRVRLDRAYISADLETVLDASYLDNVYLTVGRDRTRVGKDASLPEESRDLYDSPILWRATTKEYSTGLILAATIAEGAVRWWVGCVNELFKGRTSRDETFDELTYTGGFTVIPFHGGEENALDNLELGVALAGGHNHWGMTPGLRGFGGRYGYEPESENSSNTSRSFNDRDRVDTRGRDFLVNIDASWFDGPLSVKGEARYYRSENAFINDDDSVAQGAYLRVGYMVTGEDWTENPSSGVELIGQAEYGSVDAGGNTNEIDYWSFTFGGNYYFNQNVRFGANVNILSKDKNAASTQIKGGRYDRQDTEVAATFFLRLSF